MRSSYRGARRCRAFALLRPLPPTSLIQRPLDCEKLLEEPGCGLMTFARQGGMIDPDANQSLFHQGSNPAFSNPRMHFINRAYFRQFEIPGAFLRDVHLEEKVKGRR